MLTTVITGGSRGIGAATVRQFAARGDRVWFLYEKEHEAARLVAEQTGAVVGKMEKAVEKQSLLG